MLIQNRLRYDSLIRKRWSRLLYSEQKCTFSRLKDIASFDVVLDVGDPQTYALLHCSVFKERT